MKTNRATADTSKADTNKAEILASSDDMTPIDGYVDVKIPIDVLWKTFNHPNTWNSWNKCFSWAFNNELKLGKQLIWVFEPIRWWFLYKMPAIATIVELEPQHKVTWEVTILPGFYARHTYYMKDLGNGYTRFGSWEKAMGWNFRLLKRFWLAHFTFVKNFSLKGAEHLEKIYSQHKSLDEQYLRLRKDWRFSVAEIRDDFLKFIAECSPLNPPLAQRGVSHMLGDFEGSVPPRIGGLGGQNHPLVKQHWKFFLSLTLLLVVLGSGSFATWFYLSYVQQQTVKMAPGVYAVLGGGGNSLVVEDGKEILVLDPKFPPGAQSLRRWIKRNLPDRNVTKIVNTHYHYDHTQGNILYPSAQIFAHRQVPPLMMLRDGNWWKSHQEYIPQTDNLVNRTDTLKLQNQEIVLTYPGIAHTHGDLWAYLPKENIIATGDLLFHTYYPFFDLGEGGVAIPQTIAAIREIAQKYPDVKFLPGHGPIATASDLQQYANYLEYLYQSVDNAYKQGLSMEQASNTIDLSQWHLKILPSFHNNRLTWATAKSNIRWVYQIVKQEHNTD
ncbi:MAG: MBL fold metallo-hydrolase [Cyanobacteria bacterium J06639_18]